MEKIKILVVDDEPNILLSLEFILDEEGFSVSTAADGAEALEKVKAFGPDLVLLDVAMPVMDGYEAARRIKELPNPPKILMLTAKAQPLEKKKGLESGADGYVTKPFHSAALLSTIRGLLSA